MTTLTFEAFWGWLVQHPNCLVRVETPEAIVYDDADIHWYLGPDGDVLVAQAIRGKRLMGEVFIHPERVAYVQAVGEHREGEHSFELIGETETDRFAAYVFVLTHGMEEEEADAAHGPAAVH